MSGNHVGPALDLGWCVVRTLNEEQLRRVRSTDRFRRERVHIWMAAGLSPAKQKKLTVGQLNELGYALQWLPFHFRPATAHPAVHALSLIHI